MRTKTLLAMFGMIASTFALFIKVMAPSNVQFVIEGNVVELNQVPSIYSTLDVLLIGASCFVLGASLIYLMQADGSDGEKAPAEPGNWDRIIEGLALDDERRIVQIVADEGGDHLPEPARGDERLLQEQGQPSLGPARGAGRPREAPPRHEQRRGPEVRVL